MDNKTITKINNIIHIIQARITDLQGRIEKLEEFKIYTQELDHEDYNYSYIEEDKEDKDRDNDYINLSRRCDRLESQDEALESLIRNIRKLSFMNENDLLNKYKNIEERLTSIEHILTESKLVELDKDNTYEDH